jgi:tRNA U34 2-thiouridine synthase MnmA/TrmU
VPALVEEASGGFTLHLEEPVYGAAAGQAAVLYEGDVVVGCGTITTAA